MPAAPGRSPGAAGGWGRGRSARLEAGVEDPLGRHAALLVLQAGLDDLVGGEGGRRLLDRLLPLALVLPRPRRAGHAERRLVAVRLDHGDRALVRPPPARMADATPTRSGCLRRICFTVWSMSFRDWSPTCSPRGMWGPIGTCERPVMGCGAGTLAPWQR